MARPHLISGTNGRFSQRASYHLDETYGSGAGLRDFLRKFARIETDDEVRRLEHEARIIQAAANEIKAQDRRRFLAYVEPQPEIDRDDEGWNDPHDDE